jgi:hypothetical protein
LSSEITKGAMYVFDDVHIIWGGVENGRPAIVQESVLFRLIYCILKKFYIYNIFWEILVCHIWIWHGVIFWGFKWCYMFVPKNSSPHGWLLEPDIIVYHEDRIFEERMGVGIVSCRINDFLRYGLQC